jgi:hypothetical protein
VVWIEEYGICGLEDVLEMLLACARALRAVNPIAVSTDPDGRSDADLVLDPEDDCVRASTSCHVPLSSPEFVFTSF